MQIHESTAPFSINAGANFTEEGLAAKFSGDTVIPCVANEYADGVVKFAVDSGSPAALVRGGQITKGRAGAGGFAAGNELTTDASGAWVVATSTQKVSAIARGAAAVGKKGFIELLPKGQYAKA